MQKIHITMMMLCEHLAVDKDNDNDIVVDDKDVVDDDENAINYLIVTVKTRATLPHTK